MNPGRILSWQQCKDEVPAFLDNVVHFAHERKLDVTGLNIDHLGLRVREAIHVDALSSELDKVSVGGEPLSTATVNGRDIMIYKLEEPFQYQDWRIVCVELPYPKVQHPYPRDGWEHAEFVLPSTAVNLAEFEEDFRSRFTGVLDYMTDMPHGSQDRQINPTIILQRQPGLSIKFHPYNIEDVVPASNGRR